MAFSSVMPSPYIGSSGIGAGVLTWSSSEGKYDPSASTFSKAVSSRDLLREGFVEMGVMESTGVHDVE